MRRNIQGLSLTLTSQSNQETIVQMKKSIIIISICTLVGIFYYLGLFDLLTFESIKAQQSKIQAFTQSNYLISVLGFSILYIATTALSLPGAALLTLLSGAIFGLFIGVIIASFSSTIGATLAFLVSRFLFKESIQSKFSAKLESFNKGFKEDGGFYLFTLRLIPAFPFFVVNLVMGLTPIKTLTFYVASQLGMLPGTIVYVNAGTSLSELNSLSGILSPKLILSFVLLGTFPILAKLIIKKIKEKRA